MNKIVAKADGVAYHLLDALRLEPGLSLLVIDFVVSPEEWVEHPKLIHHHPEVFRRYKLISWNVCTSKRMASNTLR